MRLQACLYRKSIGNRYYVPGLLLLQILHHIFNPVPLEVILTVGTTGKIERKKVMITDGFPAYAVYRWNIKSDLGIPVVAEW